MDAVCVITIVQSIMATVATMTCESPERAFSGDESIFDGLDERVREHLLALHRTTPRHWLRFTDAGYKERHELCKDINLTWFLLQDICRTGLQEEAIKRGLDHRGDVIAKHLPDCQDATVLALHEITRE